MVMANPCTTRWTRPGQIAPVDAEGQLIGLAGLLDRLAAVGGQAVIVGPHGSGKSTLLIRLCQEAEARGQPTVICRLGSGPWRDAATAIAAVLGAAASCLVCLDSWERLGRFSQRATLLAARWSGCGLLVTSHGPAGLPVLVQHEPTIATLGAIVRQLPEAERWLGGVITNADLREAFARQGPNLREALFQLYDRFEERQHELKTVGS
jgi:GTPase SAR1 family protein